MSTLPGGPPRLFYIPNPAHKTSTSEAGPPRWHPDKSACPDMSTGERDELVTSSVPLDPSDSVCPVRYAVRRHGGRIEWFMTRLTQRHPDGRVEIHGYPIAPESTKVPPWVLRRMRDQNVISPAEYRALV